MVVLSAEQLSRMSRLLDEALLLSRDGRQHWLDALGPEHFQVAYSLSSLALLSHWQGKYVEAEQQFQRAIRIQEQALDPDDPRVGYLLEDLARFR